ncbi:MAG: 4a-hydroxytetrahydrobiopterin dehydratase [Patescibacteria group bacterium]
MSELKNKKCVPCEVGAPPLSADVIAQHLVQLNPEWKVMDGKKIVRSFIFKDFKDALVFANSVGDCAEQEGHHPDLYVAWGKVTVELWTHAVGGLSENDFILAAKIDAL